jgi:acyl-CoA thioesterase-2
VAIGTPLGTAILSSLDGLLEALRLEPVATDSFRVPSEPGRFADRVYGGQLLAQALVAAAATVTGKDPHSLHAAFVRAGAPHLPVDLMVDRVRDGRSVSTRRVTVGQQGATLLEAIVSFHANPPGPDVGAGPPLAAAPETLPLLQDWAEQGAGDGQGHNRSWIERPPPLEIRIGEALTFLGGAQADGPRSHWMRLPRDIGADPALHSALLAYASDFFLMDVVFRSHPDGAGIGNFAGYSLDHAIWLHRPVHFDQWHLHTQESLAVVGDRGLARGVIHDADGRLVATVMQEVLVRRNVKP